MATYNYKVKTQTNEIREGTIDAPSQEVALDTLQAKNLVVFFLEEAKRDIFKQDIFAAFSKPKSKDLVMFTRQLATLISADVSLVTGLKILQQQVEKPSFAKIIDEISTAIEGGSSLSGALSLHPELFSPFYISLVKSGEVSGKLDATLLYLADHLEGSAALNSKIRGALSYPIFVLFAMVVVSVIMVVYVLPNLLVILKEAGVKDLPLSTRALIWITDFVNNNLIILGLALVGGIYAVLSYAKTTAGRLRWDRFKIEVPGFGRVVRNLYIARFAETLSTLVKSGVPILQGLEVTSDVMGNIIFKNIILEARENVRSGGTISETLSKFEEFPPLVTSMLSVGEKTGKTDFMLDNILKFYKTESDNDIQNISSLIEPALILVLGFGVAILVASILLPIYSMVGGS